MSIFEDFALPFDANKIHWRVGATNAKKLKCKPWEATSGIALAYLNARDVMERLDDVVGGANWQDRYPYAGCCELSVRIDGEWITKSDASDVSDVEGIKGQASGAFKRAAVKFSIGRYLYDLPNTWCDLSNGQLKTKPKLPSWAVPVKYEPEQKEAFDRLIQTEESLELFLMLQRLPVPVQTALHNSFPKGEITKNKKEARRIEQAGAKLFQEYTAGIRLAIKENDAGMLKELGDELGNIGKQHVFSLLTDEEQAVAKELSSE